ncbi:MAG: hypothetical protein IJM55_07910 [Ruminococcus sp.]|nr:hypothetical protein [Ruminococcus sp.]
MKKAFTAMAAAILLFTAGCGKAPESQSGEFDYDLTGLNANMMYGQIYDMTVNPDKYKGKSMKMTGNFAYFKDPAQKEYFSVFIPDAAACCSQGVEFVLKEDRTYPEDYPEIGDPITVTGIFDAYDEYGITYCRLLDAELFTESDESTTT